MLHVNVCNIWVTCTWYWEIILYICLCILMYFMIFVGEVRCSPDSSGGAKLVQGLGVPQSPSPVLLTGNPCSR